MFKDLNNLYKRIIDNLSDGEIKKPILHVEASQISEKLHDIFQLNGTEAISLIEWQSATLLGYKHLENFDIITASKGISSMIKAEVSTIKSLEITGTVEDISIIMDKQIHIIYLFKSYPSFCLYFVFNPSYSNLALAKSTIATLANTFSDIHQIALEKLEKKLEKKEV